MNYAILLCVVISCILTPHASSSPMFQHFFDAATDCEKHCDVTYIKASLQGACDKGCRLLTIIALAKDLPTNSNKTAKLCYSACGEAYTSTLEDKACIDGCKTESFTPEPEEEKDNQTQTLHLLTPLMYVRSVYKAVAQHMKQLVTSSFTLYVEEDTGKMVVLQSNPKTIIELTNNGKDGKDSSDFKSSQRADWMDCISQQSGLPRWILVSVLFGFIVTLLWLCCVTTVTAPNQHLSSSKKISPKNDVAYLYFYEPVDEVKIQPPADQQAPPLPIKVNLS